MTAATTTRIQAKGKSPAGPIASPAPLAVPTPPRVTYAQFVHAPVALQLAERERLVETVLTTLAETIPYQSTLPAHNSNELESINAAIYREQHVHQHNTECNDSTYIYHCSSHTYANKMPIHNKCEYYNTSRNHYIACCDMKYRD